MKYLITSINSNKKPAHFTKNIEDLKSAHFAKKKLLNDFKLKLPLIFHAWTQDICSQRNLLIFQRCPNPRNNATLFCLLNFMPGHGTFEHLLTKKSAHFSKMSHS